MGAQISQQGLKGFAKPGISASLGGQACFFFLLQTFMTRVTKTKSFDFVQDQTRGLIPSKGSRRDGRKHALWSQPESSDSTTVQVPLNRWLLPKEPVSLISFLSQRTFRFPGNGDVASIPRV